MTILSRWFGSRNGKTPPHHTPYRRRPRLEHLEDRLAPATLTVVSSADTGVGTLRAQIALAGAGDTIDFDATLVTQPINLQSQIAIAKNLTIDGSGVNVTVSGNNTNRIFNITAGNVSINALVFTNGEVNDNGGAILVGQDATLSVNGCDFTNNEALGVGHSGGAIYCEGDLS